MKILRLLSNSAKDMSKLQNKDNICPVLSSRCGEQDPLAVMQQFKDFYEEKLNEIDVQGGGDCLELKLKIQRRWIDDLTEQTRMMAQIVKELEDEATNRVRMLEDKLRQTSKSAYEVMKRYQNYSVSHNLDEPFQKVFYLESDLKNVLEFVRRLRDDKKWSIDGLHFYDVSYKDLFGEYDDKDTNLLPITNGLGNKKEAPSANDKDFEEHVQVVKELSLQLEKKNEEYEQLKSSMLDMRSALTEEVACKHDIISSLKKDVQQLEERCIQSDKQTAFKDDIIKELRKEIKQTKHQENASCQSGILDTSLRKIIEQVDNMKKKIKKIYLKRKMTENQLKALEEDNSSKNLLISSLYNIIKGLLNKLAMFEYRNKEKEAELSNELEKAKSIISKLKPCADTRSISTFTEDCCGVIPNFKLIQNKDDTIQIQNNTLNLMEIELQASRKREKELEEQLQKKQGELDKFKCKCAALEKAATNNQERAENLQKAIDLYLNTINVLEVTEEKSRLEIEQQKMTINNLQEALVNVKHELDEIKQNSQQEVRHFQYLCHVLYVNLNDLEENNSKLLESYKKLQDCSFELEVEHFSALQDIAIFETQLYKYQSEFKINEEARIAAKSEIKKLRHQNRYYAHVIDCFKNEMTVMSEQLVHLQEILNLSNQSCREENGQLYNAVVELQKLSDKLQAQLIDTEKRALIENQKNQLKDAKIDELQLIIGQKNADLNIHDEAISEMKMKLENAVMENHELQATIVSLNSTIMQLQCCLQNKEVEKCRTKSKIATCKRSSSECRYDYAKKRRRSEDFESMFRELEKVKEKSKEKIRDLKRQNDDLKDKLENCEIDNRHLVDQISRLKEQMALATHSDFYREHELTQSKQIVLELRQTLIELNENLADNELHRNNLAEDFNISTGKISREHEDIYTSCRYEIALYKKLAENLKEEMLQLKKKIDEMEVKNRSLREEVKKKEEKVSEVQKKATKKEKDHCQCIEELREKLKEAGKREKDHFQSIEELQEKLKDANKKEKDHCQCIEELQEKLKEANKREKDHCCCIEELRQVLTEAAKKEKDNCQCIDKLHEEIKDASKKERDYCRCIDELNQKLQEALKKDEENCQCIDDLNEELQQSREKAKRLTEFIDTMRSEVQKRLEEKKTTEQERVLLNCCNCNNITATQDEINALKIEIKNMIQNQLALNNENDKLLKEVTCLQTNVASLEDKIRHLKQKLEKLQVENQSLKEKNKTLVLEKEAYGQTIRSLEVELVDARNCRDDICAESKQVVNNVKAWLEEQKKINEKVKKKAKGYYDTIMKLKEEKDTLLTVRPLVNSTLRTTYERTYKPCTPNDCPNYWSLGSQGTESPRESCCCCSVEEWYSPNYRDDDETDEDLVSSLEAAKQEMRHNNRKFKDKYSEFVVSKDNK